MGLRNIIAKRDQTQTSLGNPLAGGLVFLYEPGTTTFIQSFSNFELTTAHESPVKLSGSGRANIWINQDCDIRIEDRNGNLILTEDNANPDGLTSSDEGTNLLSNPSFESDTDADGTPDSWTLVNDPASTNARDTSESTDGAASFRFTSAGSGGGTLTTTNFFPVNGTDNLQVNFDIRSTDATVKNIVRVEWYDISQVAISDTDVYDSVTNPTSFERQKISAIPPATARFAKIKLIGIDPSVVKTGSTFFDNLNVFYPITSSGIFDNVQIQLNEIITTDVDGDLELNPNGVGSVNVKNDLVVGGNITTLGIGSSATGERLLLTDTSLAVGTSGTDFNIHQTANNRILTIYGGTSGDGGNILMGGSTSASLPGDFHLRTGANIVIGFDESTGILTLFTGTGSKILALRIDANQVALFAKPIEGGASHLQTEFDLTNGGADDLTVADFTSIPSWVNKITVMLDGASLSINDFIVVQLGDSGGVETAGYVGQTSSNAGLSSWGSFTGATTTRVGSGGRLVSGQVIIKRMNSSNKWVIGVLTNDGTEEMSGSGIKTLTGELTQIRITGSGGSQTFDNGTANIMWE